MKTSKILATASTVLLSQFLAIKTYAVGDALEWISGINGVSGNLNTFIVNVINIAIGLAALVCVVVLIGSGYMYITAAGDESKVEKATKSLTGAIIGLVICFIAVILVQFVLRTVLKQS
jgi:hypothetical protein